MQDVATRWNSTYLMIERVCEQQLPISAVLLQRRDLIHLEISPTEWRILEDIMKLLEPFKIATEHLAGEKYPTISAVGPLLTEIKKRVAEDGNESNDSNTIAVFKKALRDDVNSRYQDPDLQMLLNKASFLDPRFKSLAHLSSSQQEEICDVVLQELLDTIDDSSGNIPSEQPIDVDSGDSCPEPKKKKRENNALQAILGNAFITEGISNACDDVIQSEVLRYKSEPSIPLDKHPLKWWATHSCVFPNLSNLSRKYLCIVATSVPSEQLFSTAGNIVSVKRHALLPENVNKLVFLNGNLPEVKLDYKRVTND